MLGAVLDVFRLRQYFDVVVRMRETSRRAARRNATSRRSGPESLIHLDRTRAVEPLERDALWDRGEPPETYPSGI